MHRNAKLAGLHALVVLAVASLVGCGTAPPSPPQHPPEAPVAPPPPAAAPAPRPGPLEAERRWLTELFEGTPVRVTAEAGGAVRVAVPMRFSFDAGSSEPKRALKGVLERVGQSLKRRPAARLAVAAPAGPIARERQRAMREQLIAMGLPAHRVIAGARLPDGADEVSLRLAASHAIHRLHDSDLPPPPAPPRPAKAGTVR